MPMLCEAGMAPWDFCCGLGLIPKEPAALAVLSAVRVPDARRTESMVGRRFFIGDVAGVEKSVEAFVEERVD